MICYDNNNNCSYSIFSLSSAVEKFKVKDNYLSGGCLAKTEVTTSVELLYREL